MKSKYLSTSLKTINTKLETIAKTRLAVGLSILVCWFYPVIFSSGLAALYPLSLFLIVAFVVLVYKTARVKEYKAYLIQREKVQQRDLYQQETDYKYTPDELTRWGNLLSKINLDKSPHWDDLDIHKGLLPAIHWTGNADSLQFLVNLMRRTSLTAVQMQERQSKVQLLTRGPRKKVLSLLALNPETSGVAATQALLNDRLVINPKWGYVMYAYYTALLIAYGWYFFAGATIFGLFLFGLLILFPVLNSQIKISATLGWVSGFEAQLARMQKIKKEIHFYSLRAQKKNINLMRSFTESPQGLSFDDTIKELNRIIGAMGLKQNIILYAIVHAVLPWDFYWTMRAEKLRKKLETVYIHWIEELTECEAFALLAEYSVNIRNGVWPKILSQEAQLLARSLRHPLIPLRSVVPNDVDLNPNDKKCLLLTGSNMSGKSTFLRTLGINLVLMRVGARVHAQQFESAPFQILTSLKRVDSLEESLSTFYSEVKNLREIRDECISHISIYLIDEIFRGTNNRERLIGAQKYIKALLQSPSIGLVTTHDLELSQMDQEYKNLVNEHFADRIENGKMIFDYKKKAGPCPSTNALKVMEMEGVF